VTKCATSCLLGRGESTTVVAYVINNLFVISTNSYLVDIYFLDNYVIIYKTYVFADSHVPDTIVKDHIVNICQENIESDIEQVAVFKQDDVRECIVN